MLASVAIFAVAYVFIASEKIDKTAAALIGATVAVAAGLVPYEEALAAIDLNVVFLLVGMMMVMHIMAQTGLFEWVAIVIARTARGNGIVVLLSFVVASATLSALLDNVTTVILIAPITILICEILEVDAIPFLILEAIASNIGGTSTMIGDPPNLVVASQSGLSFIDFVVHLAPLVVVLMVVVTGLLWVLFARRVRVEPDARARIMRAEPALAIIDPPKLKRCLAVFSGILAAFFGSHAVGVDPGLIALCGGLVMTLVCRNDLETVLESVEWNSVFFFVGLFMLIGSLEHNGLFELLGRSLLEFTEGNLWITLLAILWFTAIGSAIVDNIPLVIAMVPLIESIAPGIGAGLGLAEGSPELRELVIEPLYWSLALGACLGGNGSLVGASANVVISQIARRNDNGFTFMQFTRYGFPIMVLTVAIASGYLYLRYIHMAGL